MFIECLGFPEHSISFPKTFDVSEINFTIQNLSENFFINYLKTRY